MNIISHRGYWKNASEKNTPIAFERSFSLRIGTETDLRDHDGKLVIAHDLPNQATFPADRFFNLVSRYDPTLALALNIKADGLQDLIKTALFEHGVQNYFLFDMSVPDAVVSIKKGLRVFTRHSDIEQQPAFYDLAAGVWMDAFFDESWLSPKAITQHLKAGKQVCLVSPELHKRPYLAFWELLRDHQLHQSTNLMLCSDFPEAAATFFEND